MKRKVIVLLMFVVAVFSLTACSSGKKSAKADKCFEALEKTVKADSHNIDLTYYKWDNGEKYLYNIQDVIINNKMYAGVSSSAYGSYYVYSDDVLFNYNTSKYYDMTLEDNKYQEGNRDEITSEYSYYSIFQGLENKDATDFMSSLCPFEVSNGIPSYREYKQAIVQILQSYEKDKNSISFIKSCDVDKNKFEIVMYAYDFISWCDKYIDSYTISSDMLDSIKDDKNNIELKISIELDNKNFVKEYTYYYIYDNNEYKYGLGIKFSDINKLDSNIDCVKNYNEMVDKYKPGDWKYAMINLINEEKEEYKDNNKLKFKFYNDDDSDSTHKIIMYNGNDFWIYKYDGYGYTPYAEASNEKNTLGYCSCEDMISYLRDNIALPEVPKWKTAYIDYINKLGSREQFKTYDLVDINKDGIPEICTNIDASVSNSLIYINKNNEVKRISYGDILFGDTCVILTDTRYGDGWDCIYKYNNETGDYTKVFEGMYDSAKNDNYSIDGVSCTKDEYTAKYNELTKDCVWADVNISRYKYKKDTLIQLIADYQ